MSFGSISREAHTTLADGHEPHRRPVEHRRGRRGGRTASSRCRTAIPCARRSSRWPRPFGVTAEYLVNADDIQIKMAQGAKPGEGGQLPGHKVDKNIARSGTRRRASA
jgi:glutamate synthase (NADPH/NADH) large chain